MDSPQEATGRQDNADTHLSEQHEHRNTDSQEGRVGGRDVMGAYTVPRMPSWSVGLERGQPGLANSSFTQRWSIASARRGASPYSRGDQADASQGPPKRKRSLSLDDKGSGYGTGDIANNSESYIISGGVRSFMGPGNEAWPLSGSGEGNAGTTPVTGGFDATTGKGAGANAGFAKLRGKGIEGNQVLEPWQGGCTDSKGANEVWTPGPGSEVETHLLSGSEMILGERSQPGVVRDSATGSSGLEQRSLTGTLATGSVGFGMGGSVNIGMSGSVGQGGGRSASGRSSGLSEVDGVPPGFMWGRGRYFAGRGLRHGLGRGNGTVFSQGPGPGNDPVLKLWGLKHNGVPRARAVAMAGAGAFAAAGRGNLAYALHPRRPARAFSTEGGKAWEEDIEATGSREMSRAGGVSEAQVTDLRPRVESHVSGDELPAVEAHSSAEKPSEQLGIENTAAADIVLKPETSGQLETDNERKLENSGGSEERNAETQRQRAVRTQIDPERPTAVARDIEIPSLGPNISDLDEARRELVASSNGRRGLGTFAGRNDVRMVMHLSPRQRPATGVNPQAVVLSAPVAPNAPLCSDPESLPLEPGAPNSGLDAAGTSSSFGEVRNDPNSSEEKPPIQEVHLQGGLGNSKAGTSSSLRLDVGDSSTPMTSRSLPRVCNLSETGQGLSPGLSGAGGASGRCKADSRPIEEVRVLTSRSGVDGRANSVSEQGGSRIRGLSKGLSMSHVGTEEEDLLEPLLSMGTAEERDGVEQQTSRKDYAMSKREKESTNERKRLDEAEIKYRKMLEREGEKEKKRERERGRERDAVLKEKRKREVDHEGQDGSRDKKQTVCGMDINVRWMKVDVPEGDSPIIPPIRLGGGSFLKWAINIGKGGGISRSPNVLMPTVSPAEGPNLLKKPMNVSPVLNMGASTSQPVVLERDATRLNTESHDGATDKNRPFLQDLVGRGLGVPSTGGSELGVVPVLKEGERVDKSEHREHASGNLDRGQNLASTPGERNDNFPNQYGGSHPELSSTRRMLSRERGTPFLEDITVPKRSHDVDQEIDDANVRTERTRRMEEHRSRFMPAGAGPLISTPLDCSGQLQQQDVQGPGTNQYLQEGTPAKSSQHEGSMERPQEAGHASAGPEATTHKIATYKNVRDMWICRYAPKGATRPAGGDLKQLGNIGLSPNRQLFLQHRASQTVTKGHILTERETSGRTGSRSDAVTRPEALTGHTMDGTQSGGVNFGTMISEGFRHGSMDDGDGSGELPHGQNVMDYAASMSAVKAWRVETGKYREEEDSIFREDESGSRRCWFCGLPGHSVLNCSETLDCELRDLGKRAVESGEILSGGDVLCLRCLGAGHWGAQCYLTVSEAASRASEKSQLWKLNNTRWIGSRADKEREQERVKRRETLPGSRSARDFTSRDTAGVVCYNCNEIGHWARYCPRRRSGSGGGQSSGSGKAGEKLHPPGRQDKFDTYAQLPSSGRLGHEPTELRRGRRLEDKAFMPLLLKRDHWRESKRWLGVESSRGGKAREVTMEAEVPLESNPYPAVKSAGRFKSENNPQPQALALRGHDSVATFRDLVLPVPQGMLAAVELIRLSRPDLQRWVDSPIFGVRVEGFFLRLRFGRLEAQQGGTGYRMACIKGAAKGSGVGKSMSISVDLGESECTIDGQFVSNQAFTEAELAEWWRGACMRGVSLITNTELECKLIERRSWPLAL